MKKILTVAGCIILVILIAIGCIAYVNRSNIASLITAFKYDKAQISDQIKKTNDNLKDNLQQYFEEDIRDFTDEENEAIKKGEMSESEALAKAIIEAPKKSSQSADAIIAKYTSQLLTLESKYIGLIEDVLGSAVAEYHALPIDQLGYGSKMRIMQKHVGTINSLEATCDGEVEAIISKLTEELNAIGADTSIINTIRQAYNNEKSLKKAYYISEYGD